MGRVDVDRHLHSSLRKLSTASAADFDASLEGVSRLAAELLDVTDVLVCFGIRDRSVPGPLHGWRNVGARRFGPNAERDGLILTQWYNTTRNQAADPCVQALVRTSGRARALLRSEVADDDAWRSSNVDALLAESGIRDRLVGGGPLTPSAELLLIAYRRTSQRRFGADERDALTRLAERLGGVGRNIAHGYGLIDSRKPFAPREREALRLLLLGFSESAAAASLGLTTRSFHQYVVALHRSLGVRSRGELMARFLAPEARRQAVARFAEHLGGRELEVLTALSDGLSEKEVADVLGLTARQVHHLVGALHRKLGVRNRASLLASVLSAHAEALRPSVQGQPE